MPAQPIDPSTSPTLTFEWGLIKPLVGAGDTDAGTMSVIQVVLLPGSGHERHNHPEADELLYFLSGQGEQMVDDGEPFAVGAGEAVLVPKGVWHSTVNTGWEPLTLLAVYAPGGPEQVLRGLPDFREVPAGETARLERG